MKSKAILALFFLFSIIISCSTPTEKIKFFLGTSDSKLEYPIKFCELDLDKKLILMVDSFSGSVAPTYINFTPDQKYLFAGTRPSGSSEGLVDLYEFNKDELQINLLNSQPSKGIGPTHLSSHPNGKSLFVANYSTGTVASLSISVDMKLDSANSFYSHDGNGPNLDRQEAPHAHYIHSDPSGIYVLSVDLGADKVYIYEYDENSGSIKINESRPYISMEPGAGPRHLAFHPSGKWFYVINELNSTLSFCSFDSESGESKLLKSISTLPDDVKIDNFPAAIRIHQNGKFLYSSNRGHNSISLFSVNSNGEPSLVNTISTEGDWPRDFNIDPSGKIMVVANQRSNNLAVFKIEQESGTLESMNISSNTSEPTCILYFEQ